MRGEASTASSPQAVSSYGSWHSACLASSRHDTPHHRPGRVLPRHRIVSGMSLFIIMGAKETTVKSFLIFAGPLAMLVGLVAMIEARLHCLGSLRRKKSRP